MAIFFKKYPMRITYNRPFRYAPPQGPLDILHRDEAILIVDKPSGLLSVPGKPEDHADCLQSRIREEHPSATIVHRLDRATSGIMVLALNIAAHRHLSAQFEQRKTGKTYIARVQGHVQDDKGAINLPLCCDWPNRPLQMVDHEQGRPAQTRWEVMERENNNVTRVRLLPLTGRSHQLRVHMREIGHPILGDDFYAPEETFRAAPRLQLHAETLCLRHPATGENIAFTAPCPF